MSFPYLNCSKVIHPQWDNSALSCPHAPCPAQPSFSSSRTPGSCLHQGSSHAALSPGNACPHSLVCPASSHSPLRAQLRILRGKSRWPSSSPTTCWVKVTSYSHRTLYSSFIALITIVVHQLFLKLFFNASLPLSSIQARIKSFLFSTISLHYLLQRLACTELMPNLCWKNNEWLKNMYGIIWGSTPPELSSLLILYILQCLPYSLGNKTITHISSELSICPVLS